MDVTIKGIENLTEAEVINWVAILVKRKEEQKLTPPKEAVDAARTTIDSFRVANGLKAEFAKEETKPVEVEPVKE
jgi:hypothetical protein